MVANRAEVQETLQESETTKEDVKLRPMNCELNPLTRADGAALLAQGGTCVLASMLGPVDVKLQNLDIEKAYVDCVFRPIAGIPTVKDKIRENMIREACEAALLTTLHPRTAISIQLQELDDRCGMEACAINAACMALLIGGVPMKFTIAAVHCIVDKDNQLLLDPDQCQAIGCIASFTFVFESLEYNLVATNTSGVFSMAQFNSAELLCRSASDMIFTFYRNIIAKFHNKSSLSGSFCDASPPSDESDDSMET